MNRLCAVSFLLLVWAGCKQADEADGVMLIPGQELDAAFRDVGDLPPMPDYPAGERGRLSVVSAGWQPFSGSWPADAGLCAERGVLELYGGEVGTGIAILVRFKGALAPDTFPVVVVDSLLPDAPAARIGAQLFREPEAFGFQAFSGDLEITEADGEVSGRFASTMREVRLGGLSHYVGTFEAIPVDTLAAEYCGDLASLILNAADSGEVGDSAGAVGVRERMRLQPRR